MTSWMRVLVAGCALMAAAGVHAQGPPADVDAVDGSTSEAQTTHAEEATNANVSEGAQEVVEPPSLVPPEREGLGLVGVATNLAIVQPDKTYARELFGFGFTLHIMGRPRGWPVIVGIEGGITSFGSTSAAGPIVGRANANGWSIGTTTVRRSIEWRHAALLMRFQPWWGWFRPYVEGAFGIVGAWHTGTLRDARGETIEAQDEQRSVGALYGLTLGIDWRLHSTAPGACGTNAIVLTTAIKRWGTTSMERPGYFIDEDTVVVTKQHAPLTLWTPYLGISVTFDTRVSAQDRSQPHQGPCPWQ